MKERRVYRSLIWKKRKFFWMRKNDAVNSSPIKLWLSINVLLDHSDVLWQHQLPTVPWLIRCQGRCCLILNWCDSPPSSTLSITSEVHFTCFTLPTSQSFTDNRLRPSRFQGCVHLTSSEKGRSGFIGCAIRSISNLSPFEATWKIRYSPAPCPSPVTKFRCNPRLRALPDKTPNAQVRHQWSCALFDWAFQSFTDNRQRPNHLQGCVHLISPEKGRTEIIGSAILPSNIQSIRPFQVGFANPVTFFLNQGFSFEKLQTRVRVWIIM